MVTLGIDTETTNTNPVFIADRIGDQTALFLIHVLGEELQTITLTEERASVQVEGVPVSTFGGQVWVGGELVATGLVQAESIKLPLFIVELTEVKTMTFVVNANDYFVIGREQMASITTQGDGQIVINNGRLVLEAANDFLYFNGQPVQGTKIIEQVKLGDRILTAAFLLEKRRTQWRLTTFVPGVVFDNSRLLMQTPEVEFPHSFPQYRRSPRIHLEAPDDKFKIEKKAVVAGPAKNSLLQALLPPLGMVAVGMLTSAVSGRNPLMMLGMAVTSLMTASFTVSQYMSEKKEVEREKEKTQNDYDRYLINMSGKIGKKYREETNVLQFKHPVPQQLTELIATYDARIYERMPNNKDFLEVGLGSGNVASRLNITSDIQERETDADTMRVKQLIEQYRTQRNAPITLKLKDQTIGLVGTYQSVQTSVAQLLLEVAFFHSYRDVNFINLVSDKDYAADWAQWRFLPHFKLQELGLRGLIHNARTRDIVLSSFYQLLNKRKQVLSEAGKEKPQFSPHYILTIFDDSYLAGHGMNEFLAEDMSHLGVTVIWVKEDQKLLPETVTALIEYKNQRVGEIINDNNVYVAKTFAPYPPVPSLERSLRQLANLEHVEVEKNAIPESLTLLEQYEVEQISELKIAERWAEAEPNKSIKSLIGWRGKREYMYWDLHERVHGPHALVGGTTGSGKSEFLTTYLLGLAINFSPEDIGMLIIDWKGGGIANTLADLPHFMGSITNLDGAGTARALASIKAEMDKRMTQFAKYGVNNINGYMSLYKSRHEAKPDVIYPSEPIPHLVLVSDEFAELKSNVPEFLDELTSVARIGRSLGVHLILATQKPSGVVNDQIEANSTSKIALKMASKQDSNELLKTHDAAHITNPGRGYLKVGENEVYELFQSGYAGVPYDFGAETKEVVDERIYHMSELGQIEIAYDPGELVVQGADTSDLPTQLEAVISELVTVCAQTKSKLPAKPWLPNLEAEIVSPIVKVGETRNLAIPLGLMDIPSAQAQKTYTFDLGEANHSVIFASPGFGKSTTLQTIVMNLAGQNTADMVQFNLFDFGTNGLLMLKDLPHVADIVTLEEEEKLTKMIERLRLTLAQRKHAFKQAGVASLAQYEQKTGEQLPICINVLDNYDGLAQSKRRDAIDDALIQVLREGAALGVYLIVTAGRFNSIRMNMMSNIQTKIALFMNDEGDLSNIFGRERLEQSEIIGRGQLKVDVPLALQVYLPRAGANDIDRLENIAREIKVMGATWQGVRPERIPMVPDTLTPTIFGEMVPQAKQEATYFGLNKTTAKPESFDLFANKSLGIFPLHRKQLTIVAPFILAEMFKQAADAEIILIDAHKTLEAYAKDVSLYISRDEVASQVANLKEAFTHLTTSQPKQKQLIILNGLTDMLDKLGYQQLQFLALIEQNNSMKQFVFMDYVSKVGNNFSMATTTTRENVSQILFGGDLNNQHFIDNVAPEVKKEAFGPNVLHCVTDETLSHIVIPADKGVTS